MKTSATFILLVVISLLLTALPAFAKGEVGSIVALRGKAVIERNGAQIPAKVKSPIELGDTIATADGAKAKILFIDDSVLTLAEKSRVNVKEFIQKKEGRGSSIFNLLDGKMRSVVGRNKFEVNTATSVAAARGTVIYFETGIRNGQPFTYIVCHEGVVDVKSLLPGFPGTAVLTPGMGITIVAGQPFPAPVPVPQPELDRQKSHLSTAGSEVTVTSVLDQPTGTRSTTPLLTPTGKLTTGVGTLTPIVTNIIMPPPPVKQPATVNIGISVVK